MIYKKTLVSLVLIFSFLFSAVSVMAQESASQELKNTYTDSEVGFSISYPEGWIEGELEGALAWFYDEETSSELIVMMEEIPEGFTAKQYAEAVGKWLKDNLPDYVENSIVEYNLAGSPGMLRVYSFTFKGQNISIPVKTMEAYTVKDNYGVAVLCDTISESFQDMEATFRQIIASFKFLE
ncbi:MAG: PsbP-related protein [bacterium]|nr:PsbP-related protein [bacterium]